ncbi:hypothetical protein ASE94_05485 [Devosia sp. Leaf64]|nr:hypothetical protein ASE94_05485 [Devosia sp. Leaf64]
MRGAGLPLGAVAQEKERRAAFGRSQAEPAARRKVEGFRMRPDIGNDAGNGATGERLLGDPQKVAHVIGPHEDQLVGIKAERF